jgi:hypothetical protein
VLSPARQEHVATPAKVPCNSAPELTADPVVDDQLTDPQIADEVWLTMSTRPSAER